MDPWWKGVLFVFEVISNPCLNHDKVVREVHASDPPHYRARASAGPSPITVGRLSGPFSPVMGMTPALKYVLEESPCPTRVLQILLSEQIHQRDSSQGKSHSCCTGLIRFPQGGNYQSATTAGTGVMQGCRSGWGGCVSPEEKTPSSVWEESQSPAPASPVISCPTSPSHHVGLPLQGQQPWSCERMWLSMTFVIHPTWGYSLTFPCVSVSCSYSMSPLSNDQKQKQKKGKSKQKKKRERELISAGEGSRLVDKNYFQLACFQMNPCDLWPMEMVVLIKGRLRVQACLVWLVILWCCNLSIRVSGSPWRCQHQKGLPWWPESSQYTHPVCSWWPEEDVIV